MFSEPWREKFSHFLPDDYRCRLRISGTNFNGKTVKNVWLKNKLFSFFNTIAPRFSLKIYDIIQMFVI